MEKKSSVGLNQAQTQNTGLNLETRKEVVITVDLNTLPRDALLMAKSAFTVKRTISQTCARVINIPRVTIDPKGNPDSVRKTNMRWKPMTLMTTANGILMNKNLFISSSSPNTYTVQNKPMLHLMKLTMRTCPWF